MKPRISKGNNKYGMLKSLMGSKLKSRRMKIRIYKKVITTNLRMLVKLGP